MLELGSFLRKCYRSPLQASTQINNNSIKSCLLCSHAALWVLTPVKKIAVSMVFIIDTNRLQLAIATAALSLLAHNRHYVLWAMGYVTESNIECISECIRYTGNAGIVGGVGCWCLATTAILCSPSQLTSATVANVLR